MLTPEGQVFLGVLTAVLVAAIIGILWCLHKKRRRGAHQFERMNDLMPTPNANGRYDTPPAVGEMTPPRRKGPPVLDVFDDDRALETHASYIIPDSLQLLKQCKGVTHKLMAMVIEGTSKDRSKILVLNNLEEIIACAKTVSPAVDRVTQTMYPPVDEQNMLLAATDLVTAVEDLAQVTQFNSVKGTMTWLDTAVAGVLHDFKVLVASIQRFRKLAKSDDDNTEV